MLVLILLAGCESGARSQTSSDGAASTYERPSPATPARETPAGGSASAVPSPESGPTEPTAAVDARLFGPVGVASDAAGDIYVSQCASGPSVISRIDRHGQLTTFAGTGSLDFAGDGGPATQAAIGCPIGMAFGPDGALYFADHASNRVRRIDTAGIVTTIAGSGAAGVNLGSFSGDGGPALSATLKEPWDVAFDKAGDLFIADRDNNRVRKVDPTGVISTVAGDGRARFAGDGGPAVAASLNQPLGLAVDAAGNLLIADSENDRVRRVDPRGLITTTVGTGDKGFSGDGGPATAATISVPNFLAFDATGALLVSTGGRVRRIDTSGAISTIVGSGKIGQPEDGAPAAQAPFGEIAGLAFDPGGNLFVTNWYNSVYRIDRQGILTLFAGRHPK